MKQITEKTKKAIHFKVIRAETFIKQNGRWHFVLGQGTNFITQAEFDDDTKKHLAKR